MSHAVDIVLVVYGCGDLTLLSLAHIAMTTPVNQVIVLDNCPDDPARSHRRLCEALGPQHTYLPQPENPGVYASLQRGLALTTTRYVLIPSSDFIVFPGWFQGAMRGLTELGMAWCGPDWVDLPAAYGYDPTHAWNALAEPYPATGTYGKLNSAHGILDWHRLRDTIGGFDPQFFFTYGDTDLIERMRDAGMAYGVIGPPRGVHFVQQSRRVLDQEEGGVAKNVVVELMDAELFHHKWRDRPDVLARHARASEDRNELIRMHTVERQQQYGAPV